MASNAYLRIEGSVQGVVDGSVTLAGKEGSILVIATDHEIATPYDQATGAVSGKPQHKPFVIVKEVDVASPKLLRMLTGNEACVSWTLDYWHPTASGKETAYYRITLTNARVVAIKAEKLNTAYAENDAIHERERVAFVYESMTCTSADGPTATVDWSASVV